MVINGRANVKIAKKNYSFSRYCHLNDISPSFGGQKVVSLTILVRACIPPMNTYIEAVECAWAYVDVSVYG